MFEDGEKEDFFINIGVEVEKEVGRGLTLDCVGERLVLELGDNLGKGDGAFPAGEIKVNGVTREACLGYLLSNKHAIGHMC